VAAIRGADRMAHLKSRVHFKRAHSIQIQLNETSEFQTDRQIDDHVDDQDDRCAISSAMSRKSKPPLSLKIDQSFIEQLAADLGRMAVAGLNSRNHLRSGLTLP
jgi:hypothetical protein